MISQDLLSRYEKILANEKNIESIHLKECNLL